MSAESRHPWTERNRMKTKTTDPGRMKSYKEKTAESTWTGSQTVRPAAPEAATRNSFCDSPAVHPFRASHAHIITFVKIQSILSYIYIIRQCDWRFLKQCSCFLYIKTIAFQKCSDILKRRVLSIPLRLRLILWAYLSSKQKTPTTDAFRLQWELFLFTKNLHYPIFILAFYLV